MFQEQLRTTDTSSDHLCCRARFLKAGNAFFIAARHVLVPMTRSGLQRETRQNGDTDEDRRESGLGPISGHLQDSSGCELIFSPPPESASIDAEVQRSVPFCPADSCKERRRKPRMFQVESLEATTESFDRAVFQRAGTSGLLVERSRRTAQVTPWIAQCNHFRRNEEATRAGAGTVTWRASEEKR